MSFRVERSITTSAPPETVIAAVTDFRRWPEWSPWEELDPDMEHVYTGADSGVGSKMSWTGNRKAGAGSMEILDADDSTVTIDLRFLKPFKAENVTTFTVTPIEGGSKIDWAMTGEQNLLMKIMGKLFSMEKRIAQDFDKGLAQLKSTVES